jgi:hypothetical protein
MLLPSVRRNAWRTIETHRDSSGPANHTPTTGGNSSSRVQSPARRLRASGHTHTHTRHTHKRDHHITDHTTKALIYQPCGCYGFGEEEAK